MCDLAGDVNMNSKTCLILELLEHHDHDQDGIMYHVPILHIVICHTYPIADLGAIGFTDPAMPQNSDRLRSK